MKRIGLFFYSSPGRPTTSGRKPPMKTRLRAGVGEQRSVHRLAGQAFTGSKAISSGRPAANSQMPAGSAAPGAGRAISALDTVPKPRSVTMHMASAGVPPGAGSRLARRSIQAAQSPTAGSGAAARPEEDTYELQALI